MCKSKEIVKKASNKRKVNFVSLLNLNRFVAVTNVPYQIRICLKILRDAVNSWCEFLYGGG